jgi:hypothetical protein
MKKNDILEYMEDQDDLREQAEKLIDEHLKKLNVDRLVAEPKKVMNLLMQKIIKENKRLFARAAKNGRRLREKI